MAGRERIIFGRERLKSISADALTLLLALLLTAFVWWFVKWLAG
jgi:hypothetical protein